MVSQCLCGLLKKSCFLSLLFLLFSGSGRAENRLSEVPSDVSLHPAVSAFFHSNDSFIQDVIIPSMERERKHDIHIRVVSEHGVAFKKCQLFAELQSHEFHFGHCNLATEKSVRKRKQLNDIFHFTCPENLTKWKNYAPRFGAYDFSKIDAMVDYCGINGIGLEWHFLSGYHPEWLASVGSDAEKAAVQLNNSRMVLNRYQGKVNFFQVFNEDWHTHVQRAKVYSDQTSYFSKLRQEFPDVELGVCDCWSFNKENRLPGVTELTARYPGIDFVSMHAHKPRRLWASPKEIIDTFDQYKDSNVKIHITEFGIIKGNIDGGYRSGQWTDAKLAEYFVQVAVASFSHPAVRVFNLWANYEKFTGNQLFSEGGEPASQYKALRSLLSDKLVTRVAGETDHHGACVFDGFHGRYKLLLRTNSGRKLTMHANAGHQQTHIKIIVSEDESTAHVVESSAHVVIEQEER
ncbi:endo-1,4-beta-xylanase [Pirellulales bacterium]|nr:endo-1,4-beta-xylanase [Pirellulales bacterium]